jgi:bifunctional non-homologous end joining protein LigD
MPLPKKIRALAGGKKYGVYIVPMLAHIGEGPFSDPDWVFEIKWDGYRAIAETGKAHIKLYSRNGLSFESKYAEVVQALEKIKHRAVLDGEIVVLNQKGDPSFQLLQHYPDIEAPHALVYYIFDLLELNGKKMYQVPLLERKKTLKKIIPKSELLRYSDHVADNGQDFFKVVIQRGMEGMMAKRKDSLYHPGRRTSDWLKIRNHNIEEVVIGGFTQPRGGRKYFGSIVLGIYEGKKLVHVGNAGTGFDDKSLRELHERMEKLERKTSPFAQPVPSATPITWIKPQLVCNIKYTEWTRDRQLRHPVFMGLREDKKPTEIKMKKPGK